MSVKNTIDINRKDALDWIEGYLLHCSDEALAQVLEVLNDDALDAGDLALMTLPSNFSIE